MYIYLSTLKITLITSSQHDKNCSCIFYQENLFSINDMTFKGQLCIYWTGKLPYVNVYIFVFISYCEIHQCTTLTKEKMLYNIFLITTVIYFCSNFSFSFLYLMGFDLTLCFIKSYVFIMYFTRKKGNLQRTNFLFFRW